MALLKADVYILSLGFKMFFVFEIFSSYLNILAEKNQVFGYKCAGSWELRVRGVCCVDMELLSSSVSVRAEGSWAQVESQGQVCLLPPAVCAARRM